MEDDSLRLVKALQLLRKPGGTLRVCYEAGPTGYGIYRRLTRAGIDCQVVAPSLIPTQAGNRVKTDRRDAKRLAQFHRSGDLTPIYVPDEAVEALRDLERAREDAKRSAQRNVAEALPEPGTAACDACWWKRPGTTGFCRT